MWITLNTLYAKISKHRYNYSTDMKMVIYSSRSLLESKSVYFPTRSNHSLCQTAHPGYFLHEAVLSVSSVEYLEAVRWPINSLFLFLHRCSKTDLELNLTYIIQENSFVFTWAPVMENDEHPIRCDYTLSWSSVRPLQSSGHTSRCPLNWLTWWLCPK